MNLTFLLFIVIIIEGYVVLASELIAIRLTTAYVGNGTDTVSIIIAAVLMPLAVGYYVGGRFKAGFVNGRYCSVRKRLARNILISSLFLLPGLSYVLVEIFFFTLLNNGIDNRIVLITLYSLAFLVTPVFLLGQTVPLVSNYFSSERLSRITGKMLFCSTVGSFLGAVVSTLVLMNFVGVNNTVNVIFLLLTAIFMLVVQKKKNETILIMIGITCCALYINSNPVIRGRGIVSNNAYNTISILEDDMGRHLIMNNNDSSLIGPNGEKHAYVEFVEDNYLAPLMKSDIPAKDILVVGSAGFTFGREDTKNRYVYVDIDPAVKDVAEQRFLKEKLGDNKVFVSEDIRSYLMREKRKFDLVFLDAYLGGLTLPEYLVTHDFFVQVKNAMNPEGVMAANFITSATFSGAFSQKLDNTLRSVFPLVNRQIIGESFDGWTRDDAMTSNIIYSYIHQSKMNTRDIYTDNKNPISFDKPRRNAIRIEQENTGNEEE